MSRSFLQLLLVFLWFLSGITGHAWARMGSTVARTDDTGKDAGRVAYSPYLMRFLNAHPSGFGGGSNWFAYADGNPISLADPFGLDATNAGHILRNTPRPPWDPIFGHPTMDFGVYAGYNGVYDQFGGRHESFCAVCHDGSVNAQVLQRMTMEGPNGMWIQVGLAFGNAAFGPHIFKNGVITVQPGTQSEVFHRSFIDPVIHAF